MQSTRGDRLSACVATEGNRDSDIDGEKEEEEWSAHTGEMGNRINMERNTGTRRRPRDL